MSTRRSSRRVRSADSYETHTDVSREKSTTARSSRPSALDILDWVSGRRSAPAGALEVRPRAGQGESQISEHVSGDALALNHEGEEDVLRRDGRCALLASLTAGEAGHVLDPRGGNDRRWMLVRPRRATKGFVKRPANHGIGDGLSGQEFPGVALTDFQETEQQV